MRIVIDTNVLLSAVFFGGVPGKILGAWKAGDIEFVISPEILEEYRASGDELESEYGDLGFSPILSAVVIRSEIVTPIPLAEQVARDGDDDKFLACAETAGVAIVVSGDKDLQTLESWKTVRVLSPRAFVDEFLNPRDP